MAGKFEKALLLCSDRHSLYNSLSEILNEISSEVRTFNIGDKIKSGRFISAVAKPQDAIRVTFRMGKIFPEKTE